MAIYEDFKKENTTKEIIKNRCELFNGLDNEVQIVLNENFDMKNYHSLIYFWMENREKNEFQKDIILNLNDYKRKQQIEDLTNDKNTIVLIKQKEARIIKDEIDKIKNEIEDYQQILELYSNLKNTEKARETSIKIKTLNKNIEKLMLKSGIYENENIQKSKALLSNFFESHDCIHITKIEYNKKIKEDEEKIIQLTNFTMQIITIIEFENKTEIEIEFSQNRKIYTGRLENNVFANYKDFQKSISKINPNLSFMSKDEDFIKFKEYIFLNEAKKKKGLNFVGFVDENTFIDSSCNNENFELDSNLKKHSNILDKDNINYDELKNLSKHLFGWNAKENTIPIVLFPIISMLNKKFELIDEKIFHLMISGEAGSGKTSGIEHVIIKMLSMDDSALGKATASKFTLLKKMSESNVFGCFLDEYKPYKMNRNQLNLISEFLRSAYDRHSDFRGNTSMILTQFKLITPCILIGEASPDETALDDRSIQLIFKKSDKENEFVINSFENIRRNKDILGKLGKSILDEVINLSLEDLKKMYNKYFEITKEFNINTRKQSHIAKCCIAFDVLGLVFNENGLNIEEETNLDTDKILGYLRNTQEEVDTKSIVELTLELYDKNFAQFQKDWHYKIVDNQLCLNVKDTYDKILKYHKEHGLTQELLTYKEFIKQLRHSKYFINYKTCKLRNSYDSTASTDEKNESLIIKKCFGLNLTKLKKYLEFDNIQ